MNRNMQPQIELNNGVKIPQLGLEFGSPQLRMRQMLFMLPYETVMF